MIDPVRPLVAIAGAEAVAAIALLIGVLVAVATGGAEGLVGGGRGLVAAEAVTWALVAVCLALVWLGLYRRRLVAHTPFLLIQAFALVVVPAFVGSDALGYRIAGILLAVAAVAGLVLGLRPAVRKALN